MKDNKLDNKYNFQEKEEKWRNHWLENKIYKFDRNVEGKEIFSIDTPPPTVNGMLHIGHIFSYTQTEMLARYKRLSGYNVFYPFGFDDNGLPSERLVEKEQKKRAHQIGREEFNKLCLETTGKYIKEFEELFNRLGVSTDWDLAYQTISPETIKISQKSFIELAKDNKCYHAESPALWCNECLTTFAQAELETKTRESFFNYITFKTVEDGEEFTIATTRPELLPAIVAVFINPDDEDKKHLIGKTAQIPLFDIQVPIIADEKVELDKGTGIVMACTFGDQTDIEWWRQYKLPLKNILTDYGTIKEEIPHIGKLKINVARERMIELLQEDGSLVKTEPIEQEVQTHERCGKEVEYAIVKQWFVDVLNYKEDFLRMGEEIKWYPAYMKARYDEWVNNIAWDWGISRQRYFGVPFPVWYCKDCSETIYADEKDLPVNPLTDKPSIDKCPNCGGTEFIPEEDVMDTWATSSVTPLINMRYGEEDNFEDILNPMSLRTNASDIIRTWDFYTIVKSFFHFNDKPWDNVMISGFVMADKGEKISKRKANNKMEPIPLLKQHSADVVRYWTGTGRLGTDVVFSEETLKIGKRLVNKLWNVSKFIEMHLEDYEDKEFDNFEYIDRWVIGKYMDMERQFLRYMENYEVGLALSLLEKFFWEFCDNYIEIVKHRLYRPEEFGDEPRYSGQKTIYMLLYKILQNFSIFLPYVTEEIFSVIYKEDYEKYGSIHLTEIKELEYDFGREFKKGEIIVNIVSDARGEKTKSAVSLKTPIKDLSLTLNKDLKEAIETSMKDFKATLFIEDLQLDIDLEKLAKVAKETSKFISETIRDTLTDEQKKDIAAHIKKTVEEKGYFINNIDLEIEDKE